MPRQYTPRVWLVCAQCGRDFDVVASRGTKAKVCSLACVKASFAVAPDGTNRTRTLERISRWRSKHPERARVILRTMAMVQRALKRGDLIRPRACEECGGTDRGITAAHDDYTRPLDVRWLCRPCHSRWDRAQPKTSPEALAAVQASWVPHASASRPGESHPRAKLTDADVLLMRALYAEGTTSLHRLAAQFGLHRRTVTRIVRREAWKHL